jgi:hypothetical protein
MAVAVPFALAFPGDVTAFDKEGRSRAADGRVQFALGLSCTLYIREGDRPEVREGMLRAYERCVALTRRPFAWGANPDSGDPEAVASSTVGDVRGWPPHVLQYFDFQMLFHGGANRDDADGYQFIALSRESEEGDLSFLSVSLPLGWALKHTVDDFVAFVSELAALVGPAHGYAGPTLRAHVTGLDASCAAPYFALGKRFRGLDLDLPINHQPYLSTSGRIKPIGFLTVLDQSFVERVGGEQKLAAFWPAERAHTYASGTLNTSGVLLQAGATPRLGDSAAHEPMPDYERLARWLEPVTDTNPALIWPQGLPGMSHQEAIAWMRRFL